MLSSLPCQSQITSSAYRLYQTTKATATKRASTAKTTLSSAAKIVIATSSDFFATKANKINAAFQISPSLKKNFATVLKTSLVVSLGIIFFSALTNSTFTIIEPITQGNELNPQPYSYSYSYSYPDPHTMKRTRRTLVHMPIFQASKVSTSSNGKYRVEKKCGSAFLISENILDFLIDDAFNNPENYDCPKNLTDKYDASNCFVNKYICAYTNYKEYLKNYNIEVVSINPV